MAIEQVNQFKQAWMSHAYLHTKEYTSIYAGQLVKFLKQLPPPLGVGLEGSYYDCQVLAKKVGGEEARCFGLPLALLTPPTFRDPAPLLPLKPSAPESILRRRYVLFFRDAAPQLATTSSISIISNRGPCRCAHPDVSDRRSQEEEDEEGGS